MKNKKWTDKEKLQVLRKILNDIMSDTVNLEIKQKIDIALLIIERDKFFLNNNQENIPY